MELLINRVNQNTFNASSCLLIQPGSPTHPDPSFGLSFLPQVSIRNPMASSFRPWIFYPVRSLEDSRSRTPRSDSYAPFDPPFPISHPYIWGNRAFRIFYSLSRTTWRSLALKRVPSTGFTGSGSIGNGRSLQDRAKMVSLWF